MKLIVSSELRQGVFGSTKVIRPFSALCGIGFTSITVVDRSDVPSCKDADFDEWVDTTLKTRLIDINNKILIIKDNSNEISG